MKLLICSRKDHWLRLYKGAKLVREYLCAVGREGWRTPHGGYALEHCTVDPDWWLPDNNWVPRDLRGTVIPAGPDNPIKSRWLGIDGGVGIHGTDNTWTLGQDASHGCIRLSVPDVQDLYARVTNGTPIGVI